MPHPAFSAPPAGAFCTAAPEAAALPSVLPPLDARLSLIASMVRRGSAVADIGADHGYLVAHLVASGICPRGIAADINAQPLARAALTARAYGVAQRISLILCNGLSGLSPADADDVVIAGMGGDTIIGILRAAMWRESTKRFLLQPMTRAASLRRWLCENGYTIEEENAACAGRFCYVVMAAHFTGKTRTCTPLFAHAGLLAACSTPAARAYVLRQAHAAEKKARGLSTGAAAKSQAQESAQLARALRECIGE